MLIVFLASNKKRSLLIAIFGDCSSVRFFVYTPSIEGGSPRMMEKKHEKKAYWETLIFVAQLFLKRAQRALWGYYVKNKLEFEGKE
jgi:hypothetical protein